MRLQPKFPRLPLPLSDALGVLALFVLLGAGLHLPF
jgi:hypothetical protein